MDRLEAMAMLAAAVETGSLSAAGRSLNVPLPTLSRKISDLEAHLGTRLLIRSTRSLKLTDAGEAYLMAARRILEEVAEAERSASGEYSAPRGDLMITAPVAFGRRRLEPVIVDFLAHYPEINVRLTLSDRNVHLIDDHVDVALRIGALPDSSLAAIRLGAVRQVVCASPAFLAAQGVPKTPADLAGLPCVTHDFMAPATMWTFGGDHGEMAVPIRSRFSVSTAEAAIDACIAGVGVTRLLSYQVCEAVGRGDLVVVLEPFEPALAPVSLVYARQGLLPVKLRGFLDFATPKLRTALVESERQMGRTAA
ncbi:MAG: LysR substrate-binding domain-containing protein [Brevundimonas sp.]